MGDIMFKLTINTDNAAFNEYERDRNTETARILRVAAEVVSQGGTEGTVFDSNGNKVGKFSFVE